MSRDKRDQRGGHPVRKQVTYSCGCCDILCPQHRDQNRTTRNRALNRRENTANHPIPHFQRK